MTARTAKYLAPSVGQWVWVPDPAAYEKNEGYLLGRVADTEGTRLQVHLADSRTPNSTAASTRTHSLEETHVNPTTLTQISADKTYLLYWPPDANALDCSELGFDDCTELPLLDPANVLFNLQRRYLGETSIPLSGGPLCDPKCEARSSIYTWAGTVLLAVNPYQEQPHLFSSQRVELYRHNLKKDVPPHPYSIGQMAIRRLGRERISCTIVVSGDSGAGKTETAKILMEYIVKSKLSAGTDSETHVTRLLGMNPILESFGNAATARNSNSSRFGRLNKLFFNDSQEFAGAGVTTYLLERSRVTHRNRGERNFHIFHQLIQGASQTRLSELSLTRSPSDFAILRDNDVPGESAVIRQSAPRCRRSIRTPEEEARLDATRYAEVEAALEKNGVGNREAQSIFELVAAILHLGNLAEEIERSASGQSRPQQRLALVAGLLRLNAQELGDLIFSRSFKTDRVQRSQTGSSQIVRNLMRVIYSRLFEHYIVKLFELRDHTLHKFIAILDIYGFEDLQTNSLEQLLINLANEKLQDFFVEHLVLAEVELYKEERIGWDWDSVPQPSGVLQLLTGRASQSYRRPPCNEPAAPCLLRILDDSTALKHARAEMQDSSKDDRAFWDRLKQLKDSRSIFDLNTRSGSHLTFTIRHFGGTVTYTVEGWVQKNNDKVAPEIDACLRRSKHPSKFFFLDDSLEGGSCVPARWCPVSKKFEEDLDSMLRSLSRSNISFIRCFKPNDFQLPGIFHGGTVLRQMRQSGTIELLKTLKLGYSFKKSYQEIVKPLMSLLRNSCKNMSPRRIVESIFYSLDIDQSSYALGSSKLFCKVALAEKLHILMDGYRAGAKASTFLEALEWRLKDESEVQAIVKRARQRTLRKFFFVCRLARWMGLTLLPRIQREKRLQEQCRVLIIRWSLIYLRVLKPLKKRANLRLLAKKERCAQIHQQLRQRNTVTALMGSPWLKAWAHRIFVSPPHNAEDVSRLLFFDGDSLWSITECSGPSGEQRRKVAMKRLYFLDENAALGDRLLRGPTPNPATEALRLHVVFQHQEESSLFGVVTENRLLGLFYAEDVMPSDASLSAVAGRIFGKEGKHLQAPSISVDLDRLAKFSPSLEPVAACFPFRSHHHLVVVAWASHREAFLTLIDIKAKCLRGRRPVNLPRGHIRGAVAEAGPSYWKYLFPKYDQFWLWPRPLLCSLLTPLLSSRALLWSGPGFIFVFSLLDPVAQNVEAAELIEEWRSDKLTESVNVRSLWITSALCLEKIHEVEGLPPSSDAERLSSEPFQVTTHAEVQARSSCGVNPTEETVILGTLKGELVYIHLNMERPECKVKLIRSDAHFSATPSLRQRGFVALLKTSSCVYRVVSFGGSYASLSGRGSSVKDETNQGFMSLRSAAGLRVTAAAAFQDRFIVLTDLLSSRILCWDIEAHRLAWSSIRVCKK